MNQATKYAVGAVLGFGLGATASYFVTMHYMEKFINYTFHNMESAQAIHIIFALNKIREGNTEFALTILEHNMTEKLMPIAYPKRNFSELSESEIVSSKMAAEYWRKYPEANGEKSVRAEIENIANGK
jgi:hypothetical protein